jgi:archaellum component FlaF (FlaF/FlaG flagellin family)
MGSSTVITHVILFIAVLSIASGLLVVIKNYADQTEGTFVQKANEYDKNIKTGIHIETLSYDNVTNTTLVYIRNTGQTSMDPVQIDVYIDGYRFSRDSSNRSVTVEADTEVVSTGIWDPREVLFIRATRDLNRDIIHEVKVLTPYTVSDTESYSI